MGAVRILPPLNLPTSQSLESLNWDWVLAPHLGACDQASGTRDCHVSHGTQDGRTPPIQLSSGLLGLPAEKRVGVQSWCCCDMKVGIFSGGIRTESWFPNLFLTSELLPIPCLLWLWEVVNFKECLLQDKAVHFPLCFGVIFQSSASQTLHFRIVCLQGALW